jgi:hypothetical protein
MGNGLCMEVFLSKKSGFVRLRLVRKNKVLFLKVNFNFNPPEKPSVPRAPNSNTSNSKRPRRQLPDSSNAFTGIRLLPVNSPERQKLCENITAIEDLTPEQMQYCSSKI